VIFEAILRETVVFVLRVLWVLLWNLLSVLFARIPTSVLPFQIPFISNIDN
jgi:hypothetical protein